MHENIYLYYILLIYLYFINVIKYFQDLSCKIPRGVFFLKSDLLTFPLLFQVDLEPEGKVFVVITLTGSFTEGKGIILPCFH